MEWVLTNFNSHKLRALRILQLGYQKGQPANDESLLRERRELPVLLVHTVIHLHKKIIPKIKGRFPKACLLRLNYNCSL